jgi:hypothetical protein
MHIEIGFGNPWWITTQREFSAFILRSRGFSHRGRFHSAGLLIQIHSLVFLANYRCGITLSKHAPPAFRLLLILMFT